MKALTNILTRLLMLMLLMLVACTEETAEVDNLVRQEQYVQVRMHVPGMTAAATRAADGEITSVTALSFNSSDQLLDVKTVNPINNVNANNGYNGNFNLTVPNGTQTIHFLANLPLNYSNEQTYVDFLKAKKGQSQVDVMTSLTTGDYQNLCYWGMATTYDGNTDPLSVTLYRNMAKITLSPSIIDPEFNDAFDETNLYIAGLDNPNLSGKLVPYNNGFYSHYQGVAPDYTTIPDGVQIFDHTYEVTEEGVYGYGRSLYVFEHENSNYIDKGLFVICRIGDAFYKVALTSDGVNPYQIIRNHEYIIYVSDVDDYQTDEYRSTEYYDTFNKTPINLEVKEVAQVAFNANATNINVNGNLTVTVDVPQDGTVTALTISAPGFTIKQGETILGNDGSYTGSDLTITGNNTTYTFIPNTFGKGKEITFTASGTNLQETIKNIYVDVNAAISASPTVNNPTLYYDQDNQTVTVNVTMPKGLSAINIGGAENFTVSQGGNAMTIDNGVYTYTRNDATATQEVQFEFTLDKSKYASQQGNTSAAFTFSDASTENAADKATSASVNNISLIPTPEVTFSQSAETIYLNGGTPNSLNVTMNGNSVPNNAIVSLTITAPDFTITAQNGTTLSQDGNVWTYNGTLTTLVFTPASAGKKPISIAGNGENIKVTGDSFDVTVKASITATALSSKIYYDGDNKDVTVRVTIPKGVSGLNISATNFSYGDDTDGVYTYDRTDGATTETTVQLVFTLKDGVTEDSSITFSDANSNANVTGATVDINVEAKPVVTNALTVTPITYTIINLADGGTKTVQLRLAIPSDLTYLSIFTNYAFEVSALNGYTQPRAQAPYYYYDYIQPGSVNTIDLEITMDADLIFETEGDYPITFYTVQNSSEGLTTTISVVNDDLDDGVIWEGSKTAIAAGYRLKYTSFSEYRDSDKQLKIDVTPTGDGWKQFYIKYEGDNNNNLKAVTADNIDSTLSIDIPSEDRDLIISGEGGITITKIYVE